MTAPSAIDALPIARTTSDFEADVVVAVRREEAAGVVGLELALPDGMPLPPWTPGAHIDLELPGGLTRQYSLAATRPYPVGGAWAFCGSPTAAGVPLARRRLVAGATLRVRGPRNNFPLQPAARYVFIAGGIGITPILPMVRAAEAAGAEWVLVYGGRSRTSMAYQDELAVYGDRVRLSPQDETGLLDLAGLLGTPAPGTLVYCCGPTGLLDAVTAQCAGWPAGSLHVERFTAAEVVLDGPEHAFEVVCEQSGLTVTVGPDVSVLDALGAAGVHVLSSCTEGICGTCETTVLDGEPDHRDSLLTEDEKAAGDTMLVCVSRCRGARLVLDL